MFSLKLLGGLSLQGPDGRVEGPAAQPLRLALLTLLAVSGARHVSRDKLVGFLWPEYSARRGRRNLSDNLYLLRRELGRAAISTTNDTVRLDPDRVGTDVTEFERALDRGEPGVAVALYGGPFLDGFHLRDCVEFERWVDAQRARLARRYAAALETLARTAESDGDPRSAVRWRRRLVAEQPYDTSATIALMRALERAGDPAGAVEAGLLHQERMAGELRAAPSPALAEELERIRTDPAPQRSAERSAEADAGTPAGPSEEAGAAAADFVEGGDEAPRRTRGPRRSVAWLPSRGLIGTAVVIGLGLGLWALVTSDGAENGGGPNPHLVAVFPFRVSGAAPSLAYLEEGMVDLLAAKFTGEGGPRAVDPRAAVGAWKRRNGDEGVSGSARLRALAAELGAGWYLTGEVTAVGSAVTLTGRLESVDAVGSPVVEEVGGAIDSLPKLVDRLVAEILLRGGNDPPSDLATVTTESLPALRSYLAAREAWRRGARDQAIRHYERALARDSTFALAAVGLVEASFTLPGGSTGRNPVARRGIRLALAGEHRLGARDRLYLSALVGPRSREVLFPWAEVIARWETVIHELADRAEVWFQLGLHLSDFGAQSGKSGAQERATSALSRALTLDGSYAPALERLIWLAARQEDRAMVDRLAARYLAVAPAGGTRDYTRWRIALIREDDAALGALRARMRTMDRASLVAIVGFGQLDGVGLDDVHRAAEELARRVRERRGLPGTYDRGTAVYLLKSYALNGGRPGLADSLLRVRWEGRLDWPRYHHDRITAALYEGGDTAGVHASVERLEQRRTGTMPTIENVMSRDERAGLAADLCLAGQWRLWQGDTLGADLTVRRVRELETVEGTPCTATLEILLAAARGGETAERARTLADAYVADTWVWPMGFMLQFAAARLYERLADPAAAAEVLLRRPYRARQGSWTLGHALHEAGRLFLAAGDTVRAASVYRSWLALHARPEPSRSAEVERIRRLVSSVRQRRGALPRP